MGTFSTSAGIRWRRRAASLIAVGVLAASLGACSNDAKATDAKPGTTASSSAPEPGPDETKEDPAPVSDFKGKNGITIADEDTTDGAGVYRQLTLAPDSPLLTEPAKKVWPEVAETFSAKDVAEAQKTVSNFMVSEGLDSILADENTKENQAAWMDENEGLISSSLMKELEGDKLNGSAFVTMNTGKRGDPVYRSGDSRFDSAKVQLAQTWVAPNDELGFQYTFTTKRHVKNPKAPEKNYIETAKGTFNYVVKKARDGTWDFTGWENDYKYKAKEVTE